jgi:mono/diheme cytochrome c family protein
MTRRIGRAALALAIMAAVTACSSDDNSSETATTTDSAATMAPPPAPAPADSPGAAAAAGGGALPAGVTAQMVAQGETTFKGGVCIACHGMDAKGTTNAPDLTDDKWINIDGSYEAIKGLIKTGVPQPKEHPNAMPPMGGAQLTDAQIADLAAYIYSLSHKG